MREIAGGLRPPCTPQSRSLRSRSSPAASHGFFHCPRHGIDTTVVCLAARYQPPNPQSWGLAAAYATVAQRLVRPALRRLVAARLGGAVWCLLFVGPYHPCAPYSRSPLGRKGHSGIHAGPPLVRRLWFGFSMGRLHPVRVQGRVAKSLATPPYSPCTG